MGKIIKEIDLSNLPRHIDGHQKNRIDWNNSVGNISKNIKNNKTYKGFKFKFISWEEYYENK